ncbi:FcoT family thioesterase [Methylocucumis oryzae]|nr:FcoT family thioesterase [Methylocucumis oryzae]
MSAILADMAEDKFSVVDIEQDFLLKVLNPYRDHCRYLKRAYFEQHENQGVPGMLMKGEFSIDRSCYIDDTGHFNAVEYNICYNQIAYLHLGYCIKHGLIPELGLYNQESFFEKQLSHFLIANISSGFQSLLNAKHFYGTFGIHSLKKTSKCTFIKTYCYFYDDEVGKSKGEVMLAILHP